MMSGLAKFSFCFMTFKYNTFHHSTTSQEKLNNYFILKSYNYVDSIVLL